MPDIREDRGADEGRADGPKVRGTRLGNPTNAPEAAALGREVLVSEADRFAANVLPVIRSIQGCGITGLAGIAGALNARGIPTARGGRWHVSTVMNVLRRADRFIKRDNHLCRRLD